jgi:predicted RNA-binding protein YlqC (UPF0109 family)
LSIDQQFVEFVIKSLVSKPEAVHIERRIDEKGVLLELSVDPEDLGRVIGKRGATAQSVRTLLRALGTKNDARYNLKIIDNGPERAPRSDDDSTSTTSGDTSFTSSIEETTEEEPATTIASTKSSDDDDIFDDEDAPKKSSTDDSYAKTRKELAELDDLDV